MPFRGKVASLIEVPFLVPQKDQNIRIFSNMKGSLKRLRV